MKKLSKPHKTEEEKIQMQKDKSILDMWKKDLTRWTNGFTLIILYKASEAYKASKSEKNMRILRAIRDWSYKFAGFTCTVEAWYLDVDIDQSFKGKQLHMYKNILETEN